MGALFYTLTRGILIWALCFFWPFSLREIHAGTTSSIISSVDLGPSFRMACWIGDLEQVSLLLKQGAPLEKTDNLGRTPLFLAAHGDPKIVKLLLAHGARVNVESRDQDSPFGRACEYGKLENAKLLLAAGADPNHANRWGRTPLILAAREGRDEIVSFLIAQHIDVNWTGIAEPALFYAVWKDHFPTAKLLLEAGAKTSLPAQAGRNRPTILTLAMLDGDMPLFDFLVAHGADINERNKAGDSVLIMTMLENFSADLFQHLFDQGADPNLADNDGLTPLILVVENQGIPALRLLLQHGAKVDVQDRQGCTALIHAVKIRAEDQVRELILHKADVNISDSQGETALAYAYDRDDSKIQRWLLQAGSVPVKPHIINKEMANPPLSKPRLWALAVGAIYAQLNGDSHDCLYESRKEGSSYRELKQDWGIEDRDSLLQEIHSLEQRPALKTILQAQAADILESSGLIAKLLRTGELLLFDLKWRDRINLAWNLCREANLIRSGVEAGYLKENEAWPILMSNARTAQHRFKSWREMNESFLESREIWANERDPEFLACSRLLLNPQDRNSPWTRLDWNTDISADTP